MAGGTQQGRRSLPREVKGSWTAISTPPYFSALAIWPSIGRWTGGGIFLSDHEVALWESEDGVTPIENVPMPTSMRVRVSLPSARRPTSAYAPSTTETIEHTVLAEGLLAGGLKWVDWISLRHADDMLIAGDGRICRVSRRRSMPAESLLSAALTLADVRDTTLQQVRAPGAAMRW